jgi:hypothetical protein
VSFCKNQGINFEIQRMRDARSLPFPERRWQIASSANVILTAALKICGA